MISSNWEIIPLDKVNFCNSLPKKINHVDVISDGGSQKRKEHEKMES